MAVFTVMKLEFNTCSVFVQSDWNVMNTTRKLRPMLPFWQNVESQAREWSPFNDEGTVVSAVLRHQQNIPLSDVRSVLQQFGFLSEIRCWSTGRHKRGLAVLFVRFLETWRYLYTYFIFLCI